MHCRGPARGIHLWQGHVEGSLTKRKDVIRLQGFPREFPEHPLPQKIRICLLFHSFDIFWKKSNQGFSFLHLKGMFQLNPSDSSLACLTGSLDLLQLVNCLQPPTARGTKLKSILKIQSLFYRAKNHIGDRISLLTQWLLPGLHILYLLGTRDDVNQFRRDMKKDI